MERVKIVPPVEDRRIRWKKVGGGSYHWNNKIIKPGQVFLATPEEIPVGLRDLLIPQENVKPMKLEKVTVVSPVYQIAPSKKEEGKFNVINRRKKILNEKPLEHDEALKLMKELNE